MPLKDKERNAEYMRQYRENNKEKLDEYHKQWYQDNKEEQREKTNDYSKYYNQTPRGKMLQRIKSWKSRNVKLPEEYGENWDIFYDQEYLGTTHCEECGVELTEDKHTTSTTRCLDHNHITGEFRNILCHACNSRRG